MDIIQPTSIFDLFQEIEEGGGGVLESTTYASNGLSQLIISYLHQYQTFLVKTTRSEYTMPSYY